MMSPQPSKNLIMQTPKNTRLILSGIDTPKSFGLGTSAECSIIQSIERSLGQMNFSSVSCTQTRKDIYANRTSACT